MPRLTFKVLITLTELNHPGDDSLSSVSASGYQSRGKVAFRMTWAMLRTKLGGKVFCKTLILTFFNSIFDLGFILPAASLKRWQALEQGGKIGDAPSLVAKSLSEFDQGEHLTAQILQGKVLPGMDQTTLGLIKRKRT